MNKHIYLFNCWDKYYKIIISLPLINTFLTRFSVKVVIYHTLMSLFQIQGKGNNRKHRVIRAEIDGAKKLTLELWKPLRIQRWLICSVVMLLFEFQVFPIDSCIEYLLPSWQTDFKWKAFRKWGLTVGSRSLWACL